MDRTEEIAHAHLTSLGHASVVFEPAGNVPPDFLVDGRIAVEVRRLNQHEDTADGPKGLESARFGMIRLMRTLLPDLGPTQQGESWFVTAHFKRPMPGGRAVRNAVRQALASFRDAPSRTAGSLAALPELKLRVFRAGPTHAHFFVFGGLTDRAAGGFVLAETKRNALICIEEKTKKVAPVRHRYPAWWLLLVDYIGYGVDPEDEESMRQLLRGDHGWDRIVLVDPHNPTRAFSI